jgi:hypothetical protein
MARVRTRARVFTEEQELAIYRDYIAYDNTNNQWVMSSAQLQEKYGTNNATICRIATKHGAIPRDGRQRQRRRRAATVHTNGQVHTNSQVHTTDNSEAAYAIRMATLADHTYSLEQRIVQAAAVSPPLAKRIRDLQVFGMAILFNDDPNLTTNLVAVDRQLLNGHHHG